MSFSNALGNALSGLTAASRAVEVVSTNVANALTEGFAPRELAISARSVDGAGRGVAIDGILRRVDMPLLIERRTADASASWAGTRSGGLQRIEASIGDPTVAGSLSSRIATLEASLIAATSRPDSEVRLLDVVNAADDVTLQLRGVSSEIQEIRRDADAAIARDVESLNLDLRLIEDLDGQIFRLGRGDRDTTALQDQRQSAVDRIATQMEIREVPRDGGRIALFTTGGAILFDGRAAEFDFRRTPLIEADMTVANGALSGLTLNGDDLRIDAVRSPIAGGRLAANFDVRDQLAPEVQAVLDSFARNLIERFEDSSLDPTLAIGAPGLFTDAGAPLLITDEIGLSGRIEINSLVDPEAGGAAWRIRDGLGTAVAGDAGDSRLIQSLATRLDESRALASGPLSGIARSTSGLASELVSKVSTDRQQSERSAAFEAARRDGLREQELSNGVDTDEEMRRLLLLEQAYSANARVIEALDELMQSLLRI